MGFSGFVAAQTPSIFEGSDVRMGAQLVTEHRCNACHQKNVGGDGSDIYNPVGKINTAGKLRGMVEACNLQLNLSLFPDEVTSIAAFLNRQHYKLTH
jgi:hypothetical protein